ncbi:hypothetical protein EDB89DRAFT_1903326 [Lactarius sanguifluus]|nr:hypothetical protein EDB89DRAFT_1903326 [Lactarius sanguifluus]
MEGWEVGMGGGVDGAREDGVEMRGWNAKGCDRGEYTGVKSDAGGLGNTLEVVYESVGGRTPRLSFLRIDGDVLMGVLLRAVHTRGGTKEGNGEDILLIRRWREGALFSNSFVVDWGVGSRDARGGGSVRGRDVNESEIWYTSRHIVYLLAFQISDLYDHWFRRYSQTSIDESNSLTSLVRGRWNTRGGAQGARSGSVFRRRVWVDELRSGGTWGGTDGYLHPDIEFGVVFLLVLKRIGGACDGRGETREGGAVDVCEDVLVLDTRGRRALFKLLNKGGGGRKRGEGRSGETGSKDRREDLRGWGLTVVVEIRHRISVPLAKLREVVV